MSQVFGPGRPAAAFHAISRLDALEIKAAEWCGFGPASFYAQLDAARQERAHYWEYADVNAAHACLLMLTTIRNRWAEWLDRWSSISDSIDNHDMNAVLGGYLN